MPQALPGQASSTPPAFARSGEGSFLRVVSNAQLDQQQSALDQAAAQYQPASSEADLGGYIRTLWQIFRNHRNTGIDPLNNRLLRAQRMFEGKYDAEKLAEIAKFGGSQVYSRVVAVKCRGASSLLRDVYLGPQRPWDIQAQADPAVPPDIRQNIIQLVNTEVGNMQQAGAPVMGEQVQMRIVGLMHAAQQAARRNANLQAEAAADKIEDIFVLGGLYRALAEFLTDLPLFPFACMKGPIVRLQPKIVWQNGQASQQMVPTMCWDRISPFDIYWTPGVSNIADADILERKRFTRAQLNDLLGVPGYDDKAIHAVLQDYAHGLREWLDAPDTEQALNEGRENPTFNQSGMIEGLEFNGRIQGSMLIQNGMDPKQIPDPDRDYSVQAWIVGRYTIKIQMNPSPRARHPYYITSFEKVPGTVSGHGLPDLLEDIQEVCNATLRAMVNNLAIASGPQVVVNDDRLAPNESGDELFPWKRWHIQGGDPLSDSGPPITFFQPNSNAQELQAIYAAMSALADEISAIPRYLTGNSLSGGAGRTASGLSMLMGNAEKVLQTVAANIDGDVMEPLLTALYDMIMLTDTSGMLTGEEEIRVRGVNVAVQKETERQKQLQFLQITANPIDAPIIGELGRARVLRSVAASLGLPDDVVPDDNTIQEQMDAQKQLAAAGQAIQLHGQQQPGQQPGKPGQRPGPPPSGPSGSPDPAQQAQGSQPPHPTPAALSDHAPPNNQFQPMGAHA